MVKDEINKVKVIENSLNVKLEKFEIPGITKGKNFEGVIFVEKGIMDAGIFLMEKGAEFTWNYVYNCVILMLEGEMKITYQETSETISCKKDDTIYVPIGAKIKYSTNNGCKMFYVCHPPHERGRRLRGMIDV